MLERLGPPDLLLFSGDLAFSGKAEEYDEIDRFLDDLLGWLTKSGAPEPLVVPVPGNHDVVRPTGRAARLQYRILQDIDGTIDDPEVAEIHEELWEKRDASFVEPLFPGYRSWFERRIRPRLEAQGKAHFSHFPCDFTLEVEPEGSFRLAIVGLNSTWIQYTGGDFDGKLVVPLEQLRAALAPADERKPYEVFERCEQALLLMHQPPQWFSERGQEIFDAEIYPGGRFTLCLYGHMHEPDSRFRSAGNPGPSSSRHHFLESRNGASRPRTGQWVPLGEGSAATAKLRSGRGSERNGETGLGASATTTSSTRAPMAS